MAKAIKDPRLMYLLGLMGTHQASHAEFAEFRRYCGNPGSNLQISGEISMSKKEAQEATNTVQTFQTTLDTGKGSSQPSNFSKSSLYEPQTRELSPPYSPPLDVEFRDVQSHTDAAVQVDIKLDTPDIPSTIEYSYKDDTTKQTREQSLDPAPYKTLAVCERCGKKILGATSQEGSVLLWYVYRLRFLL